MINEEIEFNTNVINFKNSYKCALQTLYIILCMQSLDRENTLEFVIVT